MATQAMIDAVRADTKVGVGTCSVIDECYSDQELWEAIENAQCNTVRAAVKWACGVERLFREREREVRAEIF